jgi:hypothetical protein
VTGVTLPLDLSKNSEKSSKVILVLLAKNFLWKSQEGEFLKIYENLRELL